MKTEQSLKRCILASLKTSLRAHSSIGVELKSLAESRHDIANVMPELRTQLAELEKAVHELNAYHNCLVTD